jgi:predicted  nucleic acid-binding Zn-ribbon protein
MANPNSLPPDSSPSISAAELRRRLLSSTPPPLNGTTGTVEFDDDADRSDSGPVSTEQMLRKLRMPGGVTTTPAPLAPEDEPSGFQTKMAAFGRRAGAMGIGPAPVYAPGYGMDPNDTPSAETQRLKAENKELKQLLGEMKHLLQEASDNEQTFGKAKQEHAQALADQQQQIDALTEQLHSIEEQIASGTLAHVEPQKTPKTRTELEEWTEDLEQEAARLAQESKRLENDRRQLQEDEEAMEKQLRDMEVAMARERALMARQETELKRLSAEIQHELEIMQRGDATLREQMQKFQRRAQEVLQKPGHGSQSGSGPQGWGRRSG